LRSGEWLAASVIAAATFQPCVPSRCDGETVVWLFSIIEALGVGHADSAGSDSPPSNNVGCEGFDVAMIVCLRPVFGEDAPVPRIPFDEGDGLAAQPFHGARESANARKKINVSHACAHRHHLTLPISRVVAGIFRRQSA